MRKKHQADNRWTVRFADPEDLARCREFVKIAAELEGMPMGRFLRFAVEQFTSQRYGDSYVVSLIRIERLSAQMDELMMACGQRSR